MPGKIVTVKRAKAISIEHWNIQMAKLYFLFLLFSESMS